MDVIHELMDQFNLTECEARDFAESLDDDTLRENMEHYNLDVSDVIIRIAHDVNLTGRA